MAHKKIRSTLFKISGIILVLLMIVLFISLPQGYKNVLCRFQSGRLVREGFNGWHCLTIFDDGGNECFTNSECKSEKCTLGSNWETDQRYFKTGSSLLSNTFVLDPSIKGHCSGHNRSPCFSGESTILENRTVSYAPICD